MATANPLPGPGAAPPELRQPVAADQAMVPAPREPAEDEFLEPSSPVARLPVELDVSVPVRNFRVRRLLALEPGQLIETQWAHAEDMPLAAGDVQLAWSEFEVVDTALAVRITRLA
jgi:flagellar motor switch/type III secretory pathway protein FliN